MDTLRFGLIGCGGIMNVHIDALATLPDIRIVAMSDPNPDQMAGKAAKYPHLAEAKRYAEAGELLAAGGLDAVVIASPHTLHTEQILASFEAGCHVLIEKPMVNTTPDARKVIEARDRTGKVGAIAYQRHGQGDFLFIREVATSGQVGKVTFFNSHVGQGWLKGTRGSWRQDPALSGGGQLNDTGSHVVDVLLWALDLQPTKVAAFIDNRGAPVDIDSAVAVHCEGGAIGTINIIGSAPMWNEGHHLWFEEGAIILVNNQLRLFDAKGRVAHYERLTQSVGPAVNFVNAIRRGDAVAAPFECGLRTIQLTEAAWKSAEQGGALIHCKDLG